MQHNASSGNNTTRALKGNILGLFDGFKRKAERGDNLQTVLFRITEAIAWCAPRVDISKPKDCFRSLDLVYDPFCYDSLREGRKEVVASVAGKRYLALGRPQEEPARNLAGGRLLIYEPDVNLFTGLEEDETNGYVDYDNVPPWDTWVAYIYEPKRDYLLSWVPPEFVTLMTSGINASDRSIGWLDEADLLLTASLRRNGLIDSNPFRSTT